MNSILPFTSLFFLLPTIYAWKSTAVGSAYLFGALTVTSVLTHWERTTTPAIRRVDLVYAHALVGTYSLSALYRGYVATNCCSLFCTVVYFVNCRYLYPRGYNWPHAIIHAAGALGFTSYLMANQV